MKKLIFQLCLYTITISAIANDDVAVTPNSEVNEKKTEASDEIVINHAMIEKFNNSNYSSDQLSFTDLYSEYSFEEIKKISIAYRSGELEELSTTLIKDYLNNEEWLQYYSEAR